MRCGQDTSGVVTGHGYQPDDPADKALAPSEARLLRVILAILGVATLALGIALPVHGLSAVGALWIVLGLVTRVFGRRIEAKRADNKARAASGETITEEVVTGPTFTIGMALVLAIGLPSLAIGLLEIGIDPADAEWRWLPIVVGAGAVAIALLGGLLSAVSTRAPASAGGLTEVPSRVTIRAMRETGTHINQRPRIELDLLVESDGRPGFDATRTFTVPFTALGSLGIGAGFRATVAGSEDSARVTIDWAHPIPREPS